MSEIVVVFGLNDAQSSRQLVKKLEVVWADVLRFVEPSKTTIDDVIALKPRCIFLDVLPIGSAYLELGLHLWEQLHRATGIILVVSWPGIQSEKIPDEWIQLLVPITQERLSDLMTMLKLN